MEKGSSVTLLQWGNVLNCGRGENCGSEEPAGGGGVSNCWGDRCGTAEGELVRVCNYLSEDEFGTAGGGDWELHEGGQGWKAKTINRRLCTGRS
jgi:hypothetical protein